MPRNANGIYSLPPIFEATPGTPIRSDQHNIPFRDVETALTNSLPRNGTAPMLGDLQMAGRKVTGLGAPTLATDAARKQDVDLRRPIDGINMPDAGLVGRNETGAGPSRYINVGNGIEFNGNTLRVALGSGLQFAGALLAAVVSRFSTQAEAVAGTNNDSAMTPLRTQQHTEASDIGWGQSWQNLTGQRNPNTAYRNTTGRPIMIFVSGQGSGNIQVSANNSLWITAGQLYDTFTPANQIIVPHNHYYRVNSGNFNSPTWSELR